MEKRLLIYSEYHLSMMAGGEHWVLEVAPRLKSKHGWKVSIVTTTLGMNRKNTSRAKSRLDQCDIEYFSVEPASVGSSRLYTAPKCLQLLRDVEKNSDVIYWLDGPPRPLSDALLKTLLFGGKRPLVQGIHLPIFIPTPKRPSHKLHNFLNLARLINPLERTNHYHAVNRDDYRILRSRGFRTFYIPNGVDTRFFEPSDEKFDTFTITFVGSSWAKGADFVPYIVDNVLKNDKKVHFVLCKGIASLPALASQLEKLQGKYPGHISLKPSLSHEDLRELYSKSHLFLFPSRYESFGIVVLEAQSCGIPVVTFDIPGAARDVVVNGVTGSLIPPYDLDSMVKEIIRYHTLSAENPENYNEISLKARERALLFDWNNIADEMCLHLSGILRSFG